MIPVFVCLDFKRARARRYVPGSVVKGRRAFRTEDAAIPDPAIGFGGADGLRLIESLRTGKLEVQSPDEGKPP
jgi:hypothetical protein